MSDKKIKVHVTGPAGRGIPTVANFIVDALKLYGLDITLVDDAGAPVLADKRNQADIVATIARLSHMGTEGFGVAVSTELSPLKIPEAVKPSAWAKPEVLATLAPNDCCYAFGSDDKHCALTPLYTSVVDEAVVKDLRDQLTAAHEELAELRKFKAQVSKAVQS